MLAAMAVGGLLAAGWLWHGYTRPGPLVAEREVLVARGTGLKAVAQQLFYEGVIAQEPPFLAGALIEGKHRAIKAGEYQFAPGVSAAEVLDKLVRGDVVTRSVTVPEGLSVAQVTALLMAEDKLTGEVPKGIGEGSLLPETYQFLRGDKPGEPYRADAAAHTAYLAEQWEQRSEGLPIATPEEAVTLASIVEKETGVPEERARVAGVYINRLRLGMKLQADPTVAYGVVQRDGAMERALTRADLATDSPYNTYTREGLPVGPIANPGRESIRAVLHPEETDALFFVATGDGSGAHWFARTLEEHNANVRRYRRR